MNDKLREATSILAKAVKGNNLTAIETEKAFTDIFLYDKEGYHLLAICAALHAKGETPDELFGLCNTTKLLGEKLNPKIPAELITDLAGTGGGRIKTINVSTAASFIVTGAGFCVAKQAYWGITSPTGSADIFKSFGIDIFNLSLKQVERALEKIKICPYFITAMSPKLKNRKLLFQNLYVTKGIRITTPIQVIVFAYSPTQLKKRIYGCYSEKYLDVLGELFTKLGNKKTLVLHGIDGIPEASNVGKTLVVEQNRNKIKRYTLIPNDFGLRKAKVDEIRTGGRERNIVDFLRILYGKEKGAKRDLVLANASAALYAMGKAKNFEDGTKLAEQILEEGLPFKKLEQLVDILGDRKQYLEWRVKAGIK